MTLMEKRLNRNDLQAYKNKERHTVHAMVPGINNIEGAGSKPLQTGALSMMNDPTPRQRAKGHIRFTDRNHTSQEYYQMGNNNENRMYNSPLPTQTTSYN